jgi:hypothetical protein
MQPINSKLDHPEVRIETTNYCNAACIMCPRENMTRAKVVMPFEHFCYLVDQAKDLGAEMISCFGYGEPLTDTRIFDKIKYCSDLGLKTFITTNGSLLNVKTANSLFDCGLTHIRFSAHGLRRENYNNVHRNLDWNKFIVNLRTFLDLNKKENGNGCITHITVMPILGESLADLKNYWGGLSDYLEIWQPHNWAGGRQYRLTNHNERGSCRRAFSGPIQILAGGEMVICCFDYNGDLVIGDTYVHSIERILDSNLLHWFQEKHETNDLDGLICENCDQRFIYDESPLLYSNEQEGSGLNKTSITKFDLVKGV